MAKNDARIDAHIKDAPDFAKPILEHVRKLVHKHCPEVEETIKWGMPHFMYAGKILCGIGTFKAHCLMGFWQGSQLLDSDGKKAQIGMGQQGRLKSVKDLPTDKEMASYIKQAMKLNESKTPVKRVVKKKPPVKPSADLLRALRANKKAYAVFEAFSMSNKREYVDWLADAKTEETRERRLETAIEWIAQGKSRNWKYQR